MFGYLLFLEISEKYTLVILIIIKYSPTNTVNDNIFDTGERYIYL